MATPNETPKTCTRHEQEPLDLPGEEWKNAPGYEGLYQVSDQGRVRSLDRLINGRDNTTYPMAGRILQQTPNGKGYLHVKLCVNGQETTIAVHRLVALAFIGDLPEGWDVHHKNEIKTDNRPSNLEPLDKPKHASLHNQGEKHPRAVLNDSKVKEIRMLIAEGNTDTQIAVLIGVSRSAVNSVRRGKTWTHVLHSAMPKRKDSKRHPQHQFRIPPRHRYSFN